MIPCHSVHVSVLIPFCIFLSELFQSHNLTNVLKAAGIHAAAFYPLLFAKVLGASDIDSIILNSGSGIYLFLLSLLLGIFLFLLETHCTV